MVIFNSYVKLPEGKHAMINGDIMRILYELMQATRIQMKRIFGYKDSSFVESIVVSSAIHKNG